MWWMTWRTRLDSPWLALAITAVAYASFILTRLSLYHGDASVFIAAGDRLADARAVPPGLSIRPESDGYDGQFFYRLALDPFTTRATDFGITMGHPAWRQQRIVYPLLVCGLALGQAGAIPAALIAINYLAVCGIAWLGGTLAQALNRHALWGSVLALYPGFLFTLARDTAEIVEIGWVLAGMWCVLRQRNWWAALCLSLAVLTKETALLAVLGIGAAYVWGARKTIRPQAFLVPLAVVAIWHTYLFLQWQRWPVTGGTGDLNWPLAEFIALVTRAVGVGAASSKRTLLEVIFIGVVAVAPLLAWRRSHTARPIKIAWALYGALALFFSRALWIENTAYFRALVDFYIWGMLIVLGAASRWRWPVLIAALAMWVYSVSWTLHL